MNIQHEYPALYAMLHGEEDPYLAFRILELTNGDRMASIAKAVKDDFSEHADEYMKSIQQIKQECSRYTTEISTLIDNLIQEAYNRSGS